MLIYLDQIGDKKLKSPSPEDASNSIDGHVYVTSTASIKTAGGLSVEKRISVGQFDGRVPLGGVIPLIGTYPNSNNLGAFTTASGIPISGSISDDGFMRCDGSLIPSNQNAKLSGHVPKIDDDRFIQGSVTAGFSVVTNLANINQGNNFVRLSVNQMPSHNHGGTGLGGGGGVAVLDVRMSQQTTIDPGYGAFSGSNGFIDYGWLAAGANRFMQLKSAVSGNHTHSIDSEGSGLAFDIRPRYISAIYLIRVR